LSGYHCFRRRCHRHRPRPRPPPSSPVLLPPAVAVAAPHRGPAHEAESCILAHLTYHDQCHPSHLPGQSEGTIAQYSDKEAMGS
jgi:hypothetical protein